LEKKRKKPEKLIRTSFLCLLVSFPSCRKETKNSSLGPAATENRSRRCHQETPLLPLQRGVNQLSRSSNSNSKGLKRSRRTAGSTILLLQIQSSKVACGKTQQDSGGNDDKDAGAGNTHNSIVEEGRGYGGHNGPFLLLKRHSFIFFLFTKGPKPPKKRNF
jgi:hypothetical protein